MGAAGNKKPKKGKHSKHTPAYQVGTKDTNTDDLKKKK
jgi:hypothetical protein